MALLLAFFHFIPSKHQLITICFLSFGHYTVAALYSVKTFLNATSSTKGKIGFSVLILCALLSIRCSHLWFVAVFGMHFLLSEAYCRNGKAQVNPSLIQFRYVFYSALYLFLLRFELDLYWVPMAWWICVGLSIFTYYYFLVETTVPLSEFVLICLVPISFYHPLRVQHLALYHLLFWWFYPLISMKRQGLYQVFYYSVQTVVFSGLWAFVFMYLAPQTIFKHSGTTGIMAFLWLKNVGYFHFFTAIALSRANPQIFLNLFSPANAQLPFSNKERVSLS